MPSNSCIRLIVLCLASWGVAVAREPVVLFDGEVNRFVGSDGEASDWPVGDGALVSTPNSRRSNNLVSRLHFRDAVVELEFLLPPEADANSGLFLHGWYEIQILATASDQAPSKHNMGAVYGVHAPLVNADAGAGKWQKLKLRYKAPRRDTGGRLQAKGELTAWLNGQKIHDAVELGEAVSQYNPYEYDTTPYLAEVRRRQRQSGAGPLLLQDHDCPVRFRSMRVTPLDDQAFVYRPDESPGSGKRSDNDS